MFYRGKEFNVGDVVLNMKDSNFYIVVEVDSVARMICGISTKVFAVDIYPSMEHTTDTILMRFDNCAVVNTNYVPPKKFTVNTSSKAKAGKKAIIHRGNILAMIKSAPMELNINSLITLTYIEEKSTGIFDEVEVECRLHEISVIEEIKEEMI